MKTQGLLVLAMATSVLARGAFDVQFSPEGPRTTKTAEAPAPAAPFQEAIVVVPAEDLRREPVPVSPQAVRARPFAVDPLQETQVLFGESVRVYEERNGWVRVEAPEQPEFTHSDRWQGYPGWLPSASVLPRPVDFFTSAVIVARYGRVRQKTTWHSPFMELPMGSRIGVMYVQKKWARVQGPRGEAGWMHTKDIQLDRDLPKEAALLRTAVLDAARQFLGEPYYWGGRVGYKKAETNPTGLDCSGLVNVAYRTVSALIPRDAHEQFMSARPVARAQDLRPGDLVFLASKENPAKVTHVMLFERGENLLESVHEFNRVRRVTFKKKFGRPAAKIENGTPTPAGIVRLGRIFEK